MIILKLLAINLTVPCAHTSIQIIKNIEDLPMKRQKRDRLDRAHAKGYKAGITGRSRDACPYQTSDSKSEWLGGWREAIGDRNVGLFK